MGERMTHGRRRGRFLPASLVSGLIVAMGLVSGSVCAQGLSFGIVGKSLDDVNFVDAWRGCADAAKKVNDECVHLGGMGAAHPRLQVRAIQKALGDDRFDALAVSITNSELIARALASAQIPVITFDSPFDPDQAAASRSYVGIDNVAFGRDLGRVARSLRPQGGTVCFMTAAHDPNLMERLWGARQALSGDTQFPKGARLKGEGGWTESERCPWNSGDTVARTMAELAMTFSVVQPDVFLSVGHWPVANPSMFRDTVAPFRPDLVSGRCLVIAAVGHISPGMKALMDDKLVHGYVSVDFYETGRLVFQTMKRLVEGRPVPPKVTLPSTVLMVR